MIMLSNWGDDDDKNNSVMRIYVLGTPSSILPAYLILKRILSENINILIL